MFHVGHVRVLQRASELGDRLVVGVSADAFTVAGDDWEGAFVWVSDVCKVVYLPRTPSVSTTGLIEHISGRG